MLREFEGKPMRYSGPQNAIGLTIQAKRDLIAKHGTPAEFEAAVWRACDDLMITHDEAVAGIQNYREEFRNASN